MVFLEIAITKSKILVKLGEVIVEWIVKDPYEDEILVGSSMVGFIFEESGNSRDHI